MAIFNIGSAQPGWRFWLLWMLASIGGVVVYISAMSWLSFIFRTVTLVPSWEIGLTVIAVGQMALGAAIGLAQWLVLRKRLARMGWWVLATVVGYSAGILTPWIANRLPLAWLEGIASLLCYGTLLGFAQWIVLREHFAHIAWWILLSIAAWVLVWALTGLAYVTGLYREPFDLLAAFLVPVAAAGAGLVWLFRRSNTGNLINPPV